MSDQESANLSPSKTNGLSVDDFSVPNPVTTYAQKAALMESKVRRNLDKPCRTVPLPTSTHSAVKGSGMDKEMAPSDQMKNKRRHSDVDERKNINFAGTDDDLDSQYNNQQKQEQFLMEAGPSPSASCNASQIMMKSLMKSYNAGNVQFYENLHRKYFDKAKAEREPRNVDPPSQLLDITAEDGATSRAGGEELSRFMADSHLNEESRSRSRSRSRGGQQGRNSKISSAANLSKFKGSFRGNEGFHTVSNNQIELDQTHGMQTGVLDDTHLFELTEKSNNTYMAYSYFNQTSNGANVSAIQHIAGTHGTTSEQEAKRTRNTMITQACHENEASPKSKQLDNESSNNAMSINFKNSIYSKIKFDPSVHNFAPSMISARHMPTHSDASASQISTMGLTSKILGRNGVITYRNGDSVEDADSEVPINSFLNRKKLLSSSSSPEIDIEEVMQRQQQRSRLGSNNRGNKSVPNIRDVKDVYRGGIREGGVQKNELSRRDLSARIDEDAERVTNFEFGSQHSVCLGEDKNVRRSSVSPPREDKKLIAASYMKEDPLKTFHQQARKTDFSEKVQNLMSPDNFMFSDQKIMMPMTQQNKIKLKDGEDTSSSFLKQLQGLISPESTKNLSYRPHHLIQQHQFLQTGHTSDADLQEQIENRQYFTDGTVSSPAQPITLTKENLPKQQDPSLLQAYQEQVRLARQRLQTQNCTSNEKPYTQKNMVLSTDQQAQLIRQQFESVPALPQNKLLKEKQRQFTSQKDQQSKQFQETATNQQHQSSVSNLDGDGHRSDFTFVLSQPTQGGHGQTECHNCGATNGSIMLDNVNGSILQSHGLRSSIGDTSMQIRKKVLTNFYSNAMPIPPNQLQYQMPNGGTASFPDGILNGNFQGVNNSITNLKSNQNSEQRVPNLAFMSEQTLTANQQKNGLRNRLPEIAASPIYSESGGAPGRKFFISLNQQNAQAQRAAPTFNCLNGEVLTDQQKKSNQLICNTNSQLRISQIQEDQCQMMTPPDPPRVQYHQNFVKSPQSHQQQPYDDDEYEIPQSQNQLKNSQAEEPQNLQELFALQQQELSHARSLLICTYDHLQRVLQQGLTMETQDEAIKLMGVIQGTTMLQEVYFHQQMAMSYGQIPEAIENEEEEEDATITGDLMTHHGIVQEEEYSLAQESEQHMSESQFQEEKFNGDGANKVYLMPKQVVQKKLKQEKRRYNDDQETIEHTKLNYVDKNLELKHLDETHRGNLKNSLLSSNLQDNTLYDLDKDTVYSFLAEESEIMPRKGIQNRRKMRDGQTSFIASHSPKENFNKHRTTQLPHSNDEELDTLAKTKSQLKIERRINQEQADKLKRMQAQIDVLTHKWSITENQLRNNGTIYSNVLNSMPPNNLSIWHPTATSITQHPKYGASYSVLGQNEQFAARQKQSTLSEILNNRQTTTTPSIIDGSSGQKIQQSSFRQLFTNPFQPTQKQFQQMNVTTQQSASLHSISLSRDEQIVQTSAAADQSKYLIELNQQLARQIENNNSIVQSLMEKQSQDNLQTAQSPNDQVYPESNVQNLITLTKITAEASTQAHIQHIEEMEKLRKRQQDFTAKIDRIGSQLSSTTGKVQQSQREI